MPIVPLLAIVLAVWSADARSAADASIVVARASTPAPEKRCLASRRRVERQLEAIAQADARADKERKARESCKSKRSCENLDRALNATDVRQRRLAKQLAQFEAEAAKACTPPAERTASTLTGT